MNSRNDRLLAKSTAGRPEGAGEYRQRSESLGLARQACLTKGPFSLRGGSGSHIVSDNDGLNKHRTVNTGYELGYR